jgi:hypothetical protein
VVVVVLLPEVIAHLVPCGDLNVIKPQAQLEQEAVLMMSAQEIPTGQYYNNQGNNCAPTNSLFRLI